MCPGEQGSLAAGIQEQATATDAAGDESPCGGEIGGGGQHQSAAARVGPAGGSGSLARRHSHGLLVPSGRGRVAAAQCRPEAPSPCPGRGNRPRWNACAGRRRRTGSITCARCTPTVATASRFTSERLCQYLVPDSLRRSGNVLCPLGQDGILLLWRNLLAAAGTIEVTCLLCLLIDFGCHDFLTRGCVDHTCRVFARRNLQVDLMGGVVNVTTCARFPTSTDSRPNAVSRPVSVVRSAVFLRAA